MARSSPAPSVSRIGPGDAGFTLIELLLVIVILGVLAAVVTFSVAGISDTGQESACKADKATLTTAEEAARARSDVRGYVSVADLETLGFITDVSQWYEADFGSATGTTVTTKDGKAVTVFSASPTISPVTGAPAECT